MGKQSIPNWESHVDSEIGNDFRVDRWNCPICEFALDYGVRSSGVFPPEDLPQFMNIVADHYHKKHVQLIVTEKERP